MKKAWDPPERSGETYGFDRPFCFNQESDQNNVVVYYKPPIRIYIFVVLMIVFGLLSLVLIGSLIAKDSFFWLYVLQLKEYRMDKLKDFFITAKGYTNIFSKKNGLRIIMALVLVSMVFLESRSPHRELIQRIVTFNVLCIMIMIDILPLILGIQHNTLKKPDRTNRMMMISIVLVVVVILGSLGLVYWMPDLVQETLWEREGQRSFIAHFLSIVLIYALVIELFLSLIVFVSHIIIYPIAHIEKKRILYAAKNKIDAMPCLTTIGISGSYGKSSVKNLLSHLLNKKEDDKDFLLATPGNINTEIGISQYILGKLQASHEYFVTEFGTYAIGESKIIGDIVQQRIGFLTGLNNQHVGLFGSVKKAIQAETEILIGLRNTNGTIYANRDDHLVRSVGFEGVNLVKYSCKDPTADVIISNISGEAGKYSFDFYYNNKTGKEYRLEFKTDLVGHHNILNLAGVLACCLDQGMAYEILYEYCKHLSPYQKTLHIHTIQHQNNTIQCIDDTYNINQNGVKAGLDLLSEYKGKKIVLIDEIIELGDETQETHEHIGQTLAQYKDIADIYLTGKHYSNSIVAGYTQTQQRANIHDISHDNLSHYISLLTKESATLLFLGRGTEKILKEIQKIDKRK